MSNAVLDHIEIVFDAPAPIVRRPYLPKQKKSWLGFCCSVGFHACMLVIGGLVFIKDAQFAVDSGLSSMDVQLVAAVEPLPEPQTMQLPELPSVVPEIVKDPDPIQQQVKPPEPVPPPVQTPPMPPQPQVQKVEPKPEPKPIPKPVQKKIESNSTINASSVGNKALTEAKPEYLRNPAPPYPYKARQNGWEGVVSLKVSVDRLGKPMKIDLEKSSGHDVLDQAAIKAVKTWRFSPAKLGDIVVESTVRVPIRFRLDDLKKNR